MHFELQGSELRYRAIFIISIFILAACPGKTFGHNPLLKKGDDKTAVREQSPYYFYPDIYKKYINKIILIQRDFNEELSALIDDINSGSSSAIFMIIVISFLYGVIHAVGPGHGKTLVATYFLSRQSPYIKGISAGLLIAIIHSISAVTIIGLIYIFIKQSTLINFDKYSHYISNVSYSLIIIIGTSMLFKLLYDLTRKRYFKNDMPEEKKVTMGFPAIVSAAGIVPCPGAAMILIFSINQEVFSVGLLSVAFLSLGMATTISSISLLVIASKRTGFSFFSGRKKLGRIFQVSTEFVSASILILFGTLLLLANL